MDGQGSKGEAKVQDKSEWETRLTKAEGDCCWCCSANFPKRQFSRSSRWGIDWVKPDLVKIGSVRDGKGVLG